MSQLHTLTSTTLELLDEGCADCKKAMQDQQDVALREAMESVCESCRPIRGMLPTLSGLQQRAHAANESRVAD